jgi:hypothetical protein
MIPTRIEVNVDLSEKRKRFEVWWLRTPKEKRQKGLSAKILINKKNPGSCITKWLRNLIIFVNKKC